MATSPEQHLALADWRRRVAELYATLRVPIAAGRRLRGSGR